MGILQSLIEQSRQPSGWLGSVMLRIMNGAHKDMTAWGLSQLKPGETILDVSCGGGAAIEAVARAGVYTQVYGIDISPEAVRLSTKRNKPFVDQGVVSIKAASVLELPFPDAFFDACVTFQSHYHWPDVLRAMREVCRVIKPGGQFILVSEVYKIEYHMKEYNSAALTEVLFREAGFSQVRLMQAEKSICVVGTK